MRATVFWFLLALTPWAWSETGQEADEISTTAMADTQALACAEAFEQAEMEAAELSDANEQRPELVSRLDERLGMLGNGGFYCTVTSKWRLTPPVNATPAEPDITPDITPGNPLRLGATETIDGRYQAECPAKNRDEACRKDIEQEAARNLLNLLIDREGFAQTELALEPDGFEGSQSLDYDRSDVTLTMDGTFYFIRVSPDVAEQPVPAMTETGGTEGTLSRVEQPGPSLTDNINITLFYTWDPNGLAPSGELALSARRWGIGLWIDNRIGVSAFWGDEQPGIADSLGQVETAGARYDIRGIGIGYRLFDNRAVTLENTMYYVDAQPYSVESLDPGWTCFECPTRRYEADDYIQPTVNLKTNQEGFNVGWMLTWKLRNDLTEFNSLSSGLHIELQF